ncbi:MAG: ABC transporter ATP-binding protein [Acidobacteria bacterium]|nr:ABC transporter ATP-binding protein [Acidobacteriota bacterium]
MDEEHVGRSFDRRLARRLLRYLWPYRLWVAVSLVLVLSFAALQVVAPLLTKLAVDRYLWPTHTPSATPLDPFLSASPWTGLAQLSALYLLVLMASFVLEFTQSYLMQWTGLRAVVDLRRQVMTRLQQLDVAFFDRTPAGRLVTRATTDVDALHEVLASGAVAMLADFLTLLFITAAMFRLSPGMTLVLLAVTPLLLAVTYFFRRASTHSYRRIRVAIAKINSHLQEHLSGIAVLQLFNRERTSSRQFAQANQEHRDAFKDAISAYAWFFPAIEFLSMLGLAGLLAYGGFQIPRGELTLGVLVAFFQYGMRFFRPLHHLSERYNVLQAAMAASERIFRLLDEPVRVQAPARSRPFPGGDVAIEFDNVWFAYQDEAWVLRDLSFRIEPGETIAVVGHTGAGKTTLISLLLRFYDVTRGVIRIGGIDIREFEPRDLRGHFGVVLQDPHLFFGTIEDNIRLGTERITAEELEEAAEQANLLDFVRSLPNGFAEPVRERGDGLSTGQKQLIGFARALAHNPRFLILDEATSSVDTQTELRLREALRQLVQGRTSIIIAHRLSTIQHADRILTMHKGRLRETGTHQQLLALRSIYWKLYQLQYQDQEARVPML